MSDTCTGKTRPKPVPSACLLFYFFWNSNAAPTWCWLEGHGKSKKKEKKNGKVRISTSRDTLTVDLVWLKPKKAKIFCYLGSHNLTLTPTPHTHNTLVQSFSALSISHLRWSATTVDWQPSSLSLPPLFLSPSSGIAFSLFSWPFFFFFFPGLLWFYAYKLFA